MTCPEKLSIEMLPGSGIIVLRKDDLTHLEEK